MEEEGEAGGRLVGGLRVEEVMGLKCETPYERIIETKASVSLPHYLQLLILKIYFSSFVSSLYLPFLNVFPLYP